MEIQYTKFTNKRHDNLEIRFLEPIAIYKNGSLSLEEKPFSRVSYYPDSLKLKYKNGKKIQEVKKNVGSDFLLVTNFILNEFDQLQEINIPEQNEFYNQFKFSYNEFGKRIKEEKFEFGKLKWTNFYYYDGRGFLQKEEWRSREFPLIDYFYENDSSGNILRKTGKYLLGQIETFEDTEFEYNFLNLCVRRKIYNEVEIFDHDEDENLIYIEINRIVDFDKSNFNIQKRMTYDNFGNLLSYLELHNETVYEKIEWKYFFADSQDWIKVIKIVDNKPELIITREFT